MLRKQQVELVDDFVQGKGDQRGAQDGVSSCHQMIMGGGKTAVISPLLVLLLADGNRLVVQCVPGALLQQTRDKMREIFNVVAVKGVYTFDFDRGSTAQHMDALGAKLVKARDTKAVVVSSPTSIKAFLLSLLECYHELSAAHLMASNAGGGWFSQTAGAAFSAVSQIGSAALQAVGVGDAGENEEALLRAQVGRCLKVYGVLQGAALLVDEVDLVLHPLKVCECRLGYVAQAFCYLAYPIDIPSMMSPKFPAHLNLL